MGAPAFSMGVKHSEYTTHSSSTCPWTDGHQLPSLLSLSPLCLLVAAVRCCHCVLLCAFLSITPCALFVSVSFVSFGPCERVFLRAIALLNHQMLVTPHT